MTQYNTGSAFVATILLFLCDRLPLLKHTHTEPILQVMNVESESILLRRMEFFRRYDIEVWLSKEVSLNISTS